jgi:hypothetical protein
MGQVLWNAESGFPEEGRYARVAFYGRPFFLVVLRLRLGVSGSPMAASTTERASCIGSDGFLGGSFFFFLGTGFIVAFRLGCSICPIMPET